MDLGPWPGLPPGDGVVDPWATSAVTVHAPIVALAVLALVVLVLATARGRRAPLSALALGVHGLGVTGAVVLLVLAAR